MLQTATSELRRCLLLRGRPCRLGCAQSNRLSCQKWDASSSTRSSHTGARPEAASSPTLTKDPATPLRERLKDENRALNGSSFARKKKAVVQAVAGWELSVGIEMHAQLNTRHKLFSTAPVSSLHDRPNDTYVAPFDLAVPGSQPVFQVATLVPAVRAALALRCAVQKISRFDRKHYFHWDQPAGYQITQYYAPLARDGFVELFARDGIAPEDGAGVRVGVKQVQLEQDTAKTTAQGKDGHLIDYNRAGVALIEIITQPDIHHPATAAALVRKVQMLLKTVDACVVGMEAGGLRADVNVSVRRTGDGDRRLGIRTEIKNLSSLKAVEDAIVAERDRQIAVLEGGGVVAGETRGWTVGGTETHRLRGKEGEVDYRYMPDPDIGPLVVGSDLLQHLQETMAMLPDAELDELVEKYGLGAKDAAILMTVDGGARLEYFYKVVHAMERLGARASECAPLVSNWCRHELGKLSECPADLALTPDGECAVPSQALAEMLYHLHQGRITGKVAKDLLWAVFLGKIDGVTDAISAYDLWFKELSADEYHELADSVVQGEEKVLGDFQRFKEGKTKAYPQGKLMHLVGKMMRAGPEQRMVPQRMETIMRQRIEDVYLPQLGKR